jgi:hypothetical protein
MLAMRCLTDFTGGFGVSFAQVRTPRCSIGYENLRIIGNIEVEKKQPNKTRINNRFIKTPQPKKF